MTTHTAQYYTERAILDYLKAFNTQQRPHHEGMPFDGMFVAKVIPSPTDESMILKIEPWKSWENVFMREAASFKGALKQCGFKLAPVQGEKKLFAQQEAQITYRVEVASEEAIAKLNTLTASMTAKPFPADKGYADYVTRRREAAAGEHMK